MPQLLTNTILWDISGNNLDVSYNLNINYPTGANGYVERGIVQSSSGGTNNNTYIVDSASGSYTFTQTPTSLYSANFTSDRNRLYKISVFGYANISSFSGSIYLQVLIGGVLYYYPLYLTNPSTITYQQFGGSFITTLTSGSNQILIQAACTTAGGTSSSIYRSSGYPLYYSVEDIGQWNTGNAVLQDIVLSGTIASNYGKYYTNTLNTQVASPIIGGYTIYIFAASSNSTTLTGTITPNFTGEMDYLVVAGGGGGGSNSITFNGDGGGGGGGFRTSWAYGGVPTFPTGGPQREAPLYVVNSSAISVQVGAGGIAGTSGSAIGGSGGNSILGNITSVGGGGGGSYEGTNPWYSAASLPLLIGGFGGSGGGSKPNTQPGTLSGGQCITGQGFAGGTAQTANVSGGAGSGGGGAGGIGSNTASGTAGGNGGYALQTNITGNSIYFAGGGGGGGNPGGGAGGLGGGVSVPPSQKGGAGDGGIGGTSGGGSGTIASGGGGGGGATGSGGIGGSGCVVVRFYSYVTPASSMQTLSFVNITPTFIVYVDATNNIQPVPQSSGYTIYGLTQTGTAGAYAVPNFNGNVHYLVVGGGGSGGNVNADVVGAGGGGAGGLRTSFQYGGVPATSGGGGAIESALSVTSGTQYSISVGAGAAAGPGAPGGGAGIQGSSSTFGSITSVGGGGGGGGGGSPPSPTTGGSGGGCNTYGTSGAAGTTNQGYSGGKIPGGSGISGAGGGGGAGGPGGSVANPSAQSVNSANNGANGGVGVASPITGSLTYYAGGGGGGSYFSYTNSPAYGCQSSIGGSGGGGAGGTGASVGIQGMPGTGGGGGGAACMSGNSNFYAGGVGGSGIIILRIATYSGY